MPPLSAPFDAPSSAPRAVQVHGRMGDTGAMKRPSRLRQPHLLRRDWIGDAVLTTGRRRRAPRGGLPALGQRGRPGLGQLQLPRARGSTACCRRAGAGRRSVWRSPCGGRRRHGVHPPAPDLDLPRRARGGPRGRRVRRRPGCRGPHRVQGPGRRHVPHDAGRRAARTDRDRGGAGGVAPRCARRGGRPTTRPPP